MSSPEDAPIFSSPPMPAPTPEEWYSTRPCVALSEQLYHVVRHIGTAHCVSKRRALSPNHNGGYDDKHGHYVAMVNEEIAGRYIVRQVLGRGSFGTVLKCFDQHTSLCVALKIARSGSYFLDQAKKEVLILQQLNKNPSLNRLVVRLHRTLVWQGHAVIVLELLSFSLYQLMKLSRYNGVSIDLTKKFAYQLLLVLLELGQYADPIFHCDLKPENVLLFDSGRSGLRVIDFGTACRSSWRRHKYIQSRYYRAPEVILGLPYTTAIDRWSLGCFLVEMHTGTPLLPGRSEAEQLARMQALLGPLPPEMIAAGTKRDAFYETRTDPTSGAVTYLLRTLPSPTYPSSLSDVLGVTTGGPRGCRRDSPGHDEAAYHTFCDFVSRLLQFEPSNRLPCKEAFQHPFTDLDAPPPTDTAAARPPPQDTSQRPTAAQVASPGSPRTEKSPKK